MSENLNLHIYPAAIVNESRIFRQTKAVADAKLVDHVVVCGRRTEGLPPVEALDEHRSVERIGASPHKRPRSTVGRVRERVAWSMAVYRHWKNRPVRVVNAHSVAVLPVSHAIARMHRAALIYDTHELETETSTSVGIQGMLFRLIERLYVRRCDAVFVVNDSIAQWYRDMYPGTPVISVHNSPSRAEALRPVDLRAKHGIPQTSRVYVHVGNIVPHRHIPEILEAFASRESHGDHVVFVGTGALVERVRSYADSHANIHYSGSVPSDVVVDTVAGADVGLCLIEPGCLSYALSLPNKALEYSMAGIPFFYTDLVEVDRLLGGESSMWKVTPTVESLVEAMASVDSHAVEAGQRMISQTVLPRWDAESARMLDEYRRLLGSS